MYSFRIHFHTSRRSWHGQQAPYPKISAYITNLEISIENKSAKAVFQTVLTSGNKTGSMSDVIPQTQGVYDFDVWLKKESNGWKVTSAKWEQVENDEHGGHR